MTPEQEKKFNEMIRKVDEIYKFMQSKKMRQISFPVDNASRIAMGVGFFGKDTATTPAGALLVNTNEGIKKFLIAA